VIKCDYPGEVVGVVNVAVADEVFSEFEGSVLSVGGPSDLTSTEHHVVQLPDPLKRQHRHCMFWKKE